MAGQLRVLFVFFYFKNNIFFTIYYLYLSWKALLCIEHCTKPPVPEVTWCVANVSRTEIFVCESFSFFFFKSREHL